MTFQSSASQLVLATSLLLYVRVFFPDPILCLNLFCFAFWLVFFQSIFYTTHIYTVYWTSLAFSLFYTLENVLCCIWGDSLTVATAAFVISHIHEEWKLDCIRYDRAKLSIWANTGRCWHLDFFHLCACVCFALGKIVDSF